MTHLSGKALKILIYVSLVFISSLPARAVGSAGGSKSITPNQNPKLQSILLNPGDILIHWTAPGDDHNMEPATGYDLRYVEALAGPINNEQKWQQATQCEGEPTPSGIGQLDSMLLSGLTPGESYYFCIKSYDETYNYSILSNSPLVTAAGNSDSVILGDINNSGEVNGVDVVYMVNYLKGGLPIPEPTLRADVNGDCEENAVDVVFLRDYLAGGPEFIQGDCAPPAIILIRPARIPSNEILHPGQRINR